MVKAFAARNKINQAVAEVKDAPPDERVKLKLSLSRTALTDDDVAKAFFGNLDSEERAVLPRVVREITGRAAPAKNATLSGANREAPSL